jgi:hypothetical protein
MMRSTFLAAALTLAAAAVHAQNIEALEAQLYKARDAAPLAIRSFMMVTRPATRFGDYEARGNADVKRGETMNFYAEPRNLTEPKSAAGLYEPSMEVDIEVRPEKGEPMKQPNFKSMKLPARSRAEDFFVNMSVSLGQAPPGKYTLTFTFRDLNSKKSASVSQEVNLK